MSSARNWGGAWNEGETRWCRRCDGRIESHVISILHQETQRILPAFIASIWLSTRRKIYENDGTWTRRFCNWHRTEPVDNVWKQKVLVTLVVREILSSHNTILDQQISIYKSTFTCLCFQILHERTVWWSFDDHSTLSLDRKYLNYQKSKEIPRCAKIRSHNQWSHNAMANNLNFNAWEFRDKRMTGTDTVRNINCETCNKRSNGFWLNLIIYRTAWW